MTSAPLTVRASRHWSDPVLGYLAPAALTLAAAVAVTGVVLGVTGHHVVLGAVLGVIVGATVAFLLIVPAYGIAAGRAIRHGTDRTAGLPLAELTDEGVGVRYRAPTFGERRTGEPADPAWDVTAPWTSITGWRDGTDPHGQPVIVLDATDVRTRPSDPATTRYLQALRARTGSPLAVRIPGTIASQGDAVREALTSRWQIPQLDPSAAD